MSVRGCKSTLRASMRVHQLATVSMAGLRRAHPLTPKSVSRSSTCATVTAHLSAITRGQVAQCRPSCQNVVGYGFTQKVFGPARIGKLFKAWWGSKACDADGRHNGAGLEAILRTIESGECLIRRYPRAAAFGPVPLQIRVLEPDYLDNGKTESLTSGGRILQGVEVRP